MADIYRSVPGTLVKTSVSQPAFLTLQDLPLGNSMIATNVKLDRAQDVQHQKTLSQDIYSYAFGEAMGRIQVGGMLFFGSCSGGSGQAISTINNYYSENNIYTKGASITCTIGSGAAFKCYLENLSVVLEASQYNTGSFSLGLSVIPPGSNKGKKAGKGKLQPSGSIQGSGGL